MRRGLIAIALGLASLSVGAQAQTETDTGSLIPVPKRARIQEDAKDQVDAARVTASDFARCVVARNPKGVARAIGLPPGPAASTAMTALATSECLDSGEMTIPQRLMRGAIFVELYRVRESKKVNIAPPQPLDLDNPILPEFQQDRMRYALLYFGGCVVKRDERDARGIVLLKTASPAQNDAFKAILPNLGPCLVSGQKIAFSKSIIEGILAEVLYRGTVGPATGAGNK